MVGALRGLHVYLSTGASLNLPPPLLLHRSGISPATILDVLNFLVARRVRFKILYDPIKYDHYILTSDTVTVKAIIEALKAVS